MELEFPLRAPTNQVHGKILCLEISVNDTGLHDQTYTCIGQMGTFELAGCPWVKQKNGGKAEKETQKHWERKGEEVCLKSTCLAPAAHAIVPPAEYRVPYSLSPTEMLGRTDPSHFVAERLTVLQREAILAN